MTCETVWCIQARRRLHGVLSDIMRERRERGEPGSDLLGCLMQSRGDDGAPLLTDEQVADNIIGVLFAAQDTTASVLTWILKFLHDNPKILEAVKVSARRAVPRRPAPRDLPQSRCHSPSHLAQYKSPAGVRF